MPHLQEKNDTENGSSDDTSVKSNLSMKQLPIMAATEKQSLAVKTESYDSADDEEHSTSHHKKQVITPSPFGASAVHSPRSSSKQGPLLSIYGSTRLFPSPIRVKKRVSLDEEDKESTGDASPTERLGQPKFLRYGRKHTLPMAQSLSLEKINKRQLEQHVEENLSANKKPKTTESIENTNSEGGESSPSLPKKKPIISPASSGEKVEDDESTGTLSRGGAYSFHGRQPYPHYHSHYPHYPPPHHHSYAGGGYPPYGPGYPMYGGFAPPPPAHYMGSPPPGGPPVPYYSPYHPPPHHHVMPPYGSPRGFPLKAPMGMAPINAKEPSTVTPGQASKTTSRLSPPSVTPSNVEAKGSSIKSVAEWQKAAVSKGVPPSTNRCVPLTEPIPSKFWGEPDKTKDIRLQEFHRLVNFPDYLAKSRTSSSSLSSDANATPDGKKHCVMCGKLRFCSVSSLVNKGRSMKQEGEEDDDGAAHIIPRQNKGLCTACDVTVWVVAADGLEIKWCKGCKNFRPWAAFGDKGSATKCVRCRDRQREKYAMQKDEIRLRRYKQTSSDDAPSPSPEKTITSRNWENQALEERHLAAANGLRKLIHAATN